MLGHLDAILEQLGRKMEVKSDKMSQKIETMHFTMCFWHSDAQIAIGVAENDLAQAAQVGRYNLSLVFCNAQELGGGRAVSLKDEFPQGFKALNLKA